MTEGELEQYDLKGFFRPVSASPTFLIPHFGLVPRIGQKNSNSCFVQTLDKAYLIESFSEYDLTNIPDNLLINFALSLRRCRGQPGVLAILLENDHLVQGTSDEITAILEKEIVTAEWPPFFQLEAAMFIKDTLAVQAALNLATNSFSDKRTAQKWQTRERVNWYGSANNNATDWGRRRSIFGSRRPLDFILFGDPIFCFTARGDSLSLPRGATPVDFAYAVHSELGDTCVGAKVNGRLVPLRTQLQSGDQVEIINSKAQTPSPTWERFVVTGKARAAIRRFIRAQQRAQYLDLGIAILQKAFRQEGQEFSERALEAVLKNFNCSALEDLYVVVGQGVVTGRTVINTAFPQQAKPVSLDRLRGKARRDNAAVPIRGLIPGMAMHFAGCCHPLPGDRIVGIVTTGRGVTIHTIDCETLESFAETPERWLDVAWANDDHDVYVGRLNVTIANEPGNLGSLTTVIGKQGGHITNLKFTNRSTDFCELMIDVEVVDAKHLTTIVRALRVTPVINSVERSRG